MLNAQCIIILPEYHFRYIMHYELCIMHLLFNM